MDRGKSGRLRSIPQDGMARFPRHIQSTNRAVVCAAFRRMGWRGLLAISNRPTERSFAKQSVRMGWRGFLILQSRERNSSRSAKRHIQSTKRKVLGYFLIFNSVTVLTRGNYQFSIINYQLMKDICCLANVQSGVDAIPIFHLSKTG